MSESFHLLRPEALYGLLLCPLCAWLISRRRHRSGNWLQEIDAQLLPFLVPDQVARPRSRLSAWWPLVIVTLIVVAMAGPSFQRAKVPVFQRADALVIALDLSDSMRANDIQPSRAERARQKIRDVLYERTEGVTGLIAYAGDAHVVTPLTDDRRTIENLLSSLTPDIMPIPGANTEAALREAIDLVTAAGMANARVLLITDDMPRFNPGDVIDELTAANIDISVLGVGTAQGAPMPLPEGGFIRDNNGEIVVPVLDSTRLQGLTRALNGRYRDATLDNSDIEALLTDASDVLGGAEVSLDRRTDTWVDQGHWIALLAALGLLPLFRRGAIAVIALAVVSHPPETRAESSWMSMWKTPDQLGAESLQSGDYETAAAQFEDLSWRGTAQFSNQDYQKAADSFQSVGSDDGFYNQGNALALAGDLDGALAAYEQSLALSPEREDAIRNRDLIKTLLEDQQQNQQENDQSNNEEQPPDSESEQEKDSTQTGQDSADKSSSDNQQGDSAPDGSSEPQESSSQDAEGEPAQDNDTAETEEEIQAQTAQQMQKFDQALEDQQKLDQWLRRVPDDPGGLLRNKFRYQSIQRLKRGEAPDEDIRW